MTVRRLPTAGATVTGLHTRRSSYRADFAALARSRVAMARAASGMSVDEFAAALRDLLGRDVKPGHVLSWEQKATPPGDVVVAVSALAPTSAHSLGMRSHKFIASYVGHRRVRGLIDKLELEEVSGYLGQTPCWIGPIPDVGAHCSISLFPMGVVIVHLLEDVEFPDVTSMALWRYQTYAENLDWVNEFLTAAVGSPIAASYVLSAYWVYSAPWVGSTLDTGLRLICSPRVLVDREPTDRSQAAGEQAEQELLDGGYHPPEMRAFGTPGVSSGWASWSGVVYHPHDPLRALAENDLVRFEIAAQAVWAWTAHLNEQLERGEDPDVCPQHGWRFLRAMRSLLLMPRPQETGQHQQMREAIVHSSGLPAQLDLALEALKEAGK